MTTTLAQRSLFAPFRLGPLTLPNRMVMAPMTRGRAEADGTPTAIMVPYYERRADAGLLITEGVFVSLTGRGWLGAPGLYTDAHVAGWRKVTGGVHRQGGRIVAQLWHMGRVSHPDFLAGALPVGPSALAAQGSSHTARGKQSYVTPRALSRAEIAATVADYGAAAARARAAGFDGVELHGANGYLIDQFLRDGSNRRDDEYGGSAAHRSRFLLEVTRAVAAAWSPDRVGVRLSPTGSYNDMRDSDPEATFTQAARGLSELGIAYLHVAEPPADHPMGVPLPPVAPALRAAFRGPMILNGGFDADSAAAALDRGAADLVSFGLPFLANPDLVRRYRTGAPLNAPDFATLYTRGAKGYADYPMLVP